MTLDREALEHYDPHLYALIHETFAYHGACALSQEQGAG